MNPTRFIRKLTRRGVAPEHQETLEEIETRRLSRVAAELDASMAELKQAARETGKTTPSPVSLDAFHRAVESIVGVIQREADRVVLATAYVRALMWAVLAGVGLGIGLAGAIIVMLWGR